MLTSPMKMNRKIIKNGEPTIVHVEFIFVVVNDVDVLDIEFKLRVRDRRAFNARSSVCKYGSKIRATRA
jgi:hypothetical protein